MKDATKYEIGKTYRGYGEVSGILFTLLKRDGMICLFERSDDYHEIITLKKQDAKIAKFGDREVELKEKEIYPRGESWEGKCIKNLKDALRVFDKLVDVEGGKADV